MVLLGASTIAQAATFTWNQTGSGTKYWSTSGNWIPTGSPPTSIPDAIDDVANITSNINNNRTVTLDQVITLGTLKIGDSTGSNVFTLAASGSGSLIMDVSSGSAAINKTSGGSDIISVAIQLNDALVITNSDNSTLTLSGIIDDGASANGITKSGTGAVVLSGANTYDGLTAINNGSLTLSGNNSGAAGGVTLTAGTLNLGNAGALGTGTLTIAGGTLNNTSGGSMTISSNNLQAWNSSFTFTGTNSLNLGTGAVTLGATSTITTTSNTLTVGGSIDDGGSTFGLTKAGAGTLALSGANTYDGLTTVNAGTLALANVNALQDSTLDTGTSGGQSVTFTVAGTNTYNLGGLQGADAVANNGNTLSVGANNQSTSYTGIISGTGGLTKVGSGTLTFSSANTYTGTTAISNGTLVLSGSGLLANTTAVNVTGSTGVFDISGISATGDTVGSLAGVAGSSVVLGAKNLTAGGDNSSTAFAGVLSGTNGSLTKAGSGTLTLSGGNTYTGVTTVSAGNLTLSGAGALADTSAVNITGGTAVFNISGITAVSETIGSLAGVAGSSVVLGAKDLTAGGDNTSTTFAGVVSGTNGSLTKTGSGTLTLSGSNTYTGATTVSEGNLTLSGSGALANTSAVNITGSTSVFDITALSVSSETIGSLAGVSGSSVVIAGKTLIAGGDNTNTSFAGVISGSSGNFTKAGTGTMTLSGANTYTGTTIISNGTLVLSGSGSLANTTAVNVTGSSAIFDISGISATGDTIGSLAGVAGSSVVLGAKNLNAGGDNTGTAFAGVISGTDGSLTKAGSGTLTLTGGNTYTGSTTVSAGGLTLSGSGALADTSAVNLTGATSVFNISAITAASETIGSLAGVSGSSISLGAKGLVAGGDNTSTSFAGSISGTGGITKTGNGTLALGATSSYTGKTIIYGGKLSIGAEDRLGNNPGAATADQLTLNGGTLLSTATFSIDDANRDITLGSAGGTFEVNSGTTLTIASTNIISGSGRLTKTGNGTLTLSGANTYTGRTIIDGGKISIGAENRLGNNPGVFAADHLSFNNGTLLTTATFSIDDGNRGITLGATGGTFEVSSGTTLTIASTNIITGSGSLTKTANGTLTLSGANTYSGKTIINGGKISIAAEDRLGGNPAAFTQDQLTLDGGTLLTTATFSMDDANRGITLGAAGGTFEVTSATTLTVASTSIITGSGGLTKTANGTLSLGAANTHTGNTTLSAGTLALANVDALQNSTLDTGASSGSKAVTFTVGGNNTYNLGGLQGADALAIGGNTLSIGSNNQSTSYTGVISGTGGALTKEGSGALTLGGNTHSYTGSTTVNGGTLILDYTASNTTKLADGAALILGTATLQLDRSTAASGTHTEVVASTTLNGMANITRGTGSTAVLRMNSITQNPGGSVNFSAAGIADTDTTNTNGILGAWATINGTDWAMNSTNGNNGSITAYTGYTNVTRLSSGTKVIASSASSNVRIIEGTGSAGDITLSGGSSATTTINTLTQSTSGGTSAATINPTGTQTLRLGAIGGLLMASGSGSLTIGTAANDGRLTAGGSSNTDGEILIQQYSGNTLTINSTITDNGSGDITLTHSGTGTTVLTGTNTYTGSTTINGGTLSVSADANLGAVPGSVTTDMVVLNGGTLASTANFTMNANRGLTIDAEGGTFDTATGTTLTYNGLISGSGVFNKNGDGTFITGGTTHNNHTGDININAGVFEIAKTAYVGGIHNNAAVTIATGATLNFNGALTYTQETIGSLSGDGTVDNIGLDNVNLITGGDNSDTTFSGELKNTGTKVLNLQKTGTGIFKLTGTNSYTGTTTVNAGSLQIDGVVTSAVAVNSGASLTGSGSVSKAITIYGVGALRPGNKTPTGSGLGTFTLSGSGADGNLTVAATGTLDLQVGANGIAFANQSSNYYVAGSLNSAYTSTPITVGANDRIEIAGMLSLTSGSIIDVTLSGYTPSLGDAYDLLDWGSLSLGTFNAGPSIRTGTAADNALYDLNLPDIMAINSDYRWDTSLFASHGIVVVVPEPSRAVLLMAGLIACLLRRRRAHLRVC